MKKMCFESIVRHREMGYEHKAKIDCELIDFSQNNE